MQLMIFYDGFCPLCQKEMQHLRKHDKAQRIRFVDIQQADFHQRFPELDWAALNARIHVIDAEGNMVDGLDATYLAWKAVGKGWLYAPTRWPVIRWFADAAYSFFARHRYRISYLLTGQSRCDTCSLGSRNGQ